MSDSRGYDDQLPWLQAVDDEDEQRGLSARKMLGALVVVLLAAMIVAATFFWIGRRDGAVTGAPQLIKAPAAPYKIKPPNPGGLDISADSQTAFETSAGEDPDARLDTSKLPAGTVPAPPKQEAKTPATATPAEPKPPVAQIAPEPPKASGGSGSVVQLGAFANRTQAERAWTVLSGRFPNVAALNKMIVPFAGGIRLRGGAGSPGDAKQVCDTLKAAGENCFVAQ